MTVHAHRQFVPRSALIARYLSILGTVGNTPVVRINRLAPEHVNLWVKVEAFNPLGSVKDRLALGIIEEGERSGELKPGQTVIEATSGNTGIGLAMVCAAKGYPLVVTMAEQAPAEYRKLLRFLGARVVLTPQAQRDDGMTVKAQELAHKHGWFFVRQFENEANPDFHARTTAREILRDFDGDRLDYWVTGYCTGGTLKGVARVLNRERPLTRIVVCEPADAAQDFAPKHIEDAIYEHRIERLLPITGTEAVHWAGELARKEGIFAGVNAGAAFAGALKVAEDAEPGANILCMLPDSGERYLGSPLFQNTTIGMSPEELELSRATPSAQFS